MEGMTMPGTNEAEPAHAKWFRSFRNKISEDYARLHKEALGDVQRAGHGGESTWVGVLKDWLPPAYDVVTRKYIVPEIGAKKFETDIVVLFPSYPVHLRANEDILAGGVAAAFSVKLTLDSAGIRDGVQRAVDLRRAMKPRYGTPRREMIPPFPVGILAHSHDWKAPASTPAKNVADQLMSLDFELVNHPRESLDYVCVADLAMWSTIRLPWVPSSTLPWPHGTTEQQKQEGLAYVTYSQTDSSESFSVVSSLITSLYVRLSYFDPTLRPLADNLMSTDALGNSAGPTRRWLLGSVFSDQVRTGLPHALRALDSEWGNVII